MLWSVENNIIYKRKSVFYREFKRTACLCLYLYYLFVSWNFTKGSTQQNILYMSSDQILKLPVQTMGFHVDVVLVCDGFWSWYVCCMIGIKPKAQKNVKACFYIFNNKKFVGSIMRKLWAFSPQVRFILWDSLTNFVKNFHDFLLILPSYQKSSLLFASYFLVKIWE